MHKIFFAKDPKSISYQRSVLTFLDCCGLIGGVNEILHLAGMLIISSTSSKIFVMSLLSSLYQVSTSIAHSKLPDMNNPRVLHEYENSWIDQLNQNTVYPKSNHNLNIKHTENSESKLDSIKQSIYEMKNRWRYNYSFLNLWYNIFWPLKWLSLKWSNRLNSLRNEYQIFSAGQHKLNRDLSVVNFVKMQHKLKTLVRLLLNRQQKLLASYSKLNKIRINSSSDDYSNSNSSINQDMPNMLDSCKAKQNNNENVNKFFDEYMQQKLTLKDYKLIHGVFTNKELINWNIKDSNFDEDWFKESSSSRSMVFVRNNTKPVFRSIPNLTVIPLVQSKESRWINSTSLFALAQDWNQSQVSINSNS